MPVKVLLIGARLCRNLGGPSLLVSTMHVLDRFLPGLEYTLISPTSEDLPLAETYHVAVVPAISRKELLLAALAKAGLRISSDSPTVRQVIDAYAEADIVVDIWGIMFADPLRSDALISRAAEGIHLLVGKIFRKPVVKYTADLGPFEARWNRLFAKLYLQYSVDLILARSDATRDRLRDLGVTTPTYVCPDTAFFLEPQMTSVAEDLLKQKAHEPLIGFSVSHMAVRQSNYPERYLGAMAELADHAAEGIGAKILLIPNELSEDIALDDEHVAKEVQSRMARKDRAQILSSEYTAQQLKAIIGSCDLVVAARYHTIVASLSQGIPVLALGWHAKYAGLLGLVGQESYVCSISSLDQDELKTKFDALWQSHEAIGPEILAALPGIRQTILAGGEKVSLLLSRK